MLLKLEHNLDKSFKCSPLKEAKTCNLYFFLFSQKADVFTTSRTPVHAATKKRRSRRSGFESRWFQSVTLFPSSAFVTLIFVTPFGQCCHVTTTGRFSISNFVRWEHFYRVFVALVQLVQTTIECAMDLIYRINCKSWEIFLVRLKCGALKHTSKWHKSNKVFLSKQFLNKWSGWEFTKLLKANS